jgi:hypothetical protein
MPRILWGVALAALVCPIALAADNPPAPGFNAADSDARAIEIADQVMERMGGRQAWDRTRHVTWVFFGSRRHAWDKYTGDIRVEGVERESGEPYLILMNLHSKEGRAWRGGSEVEGAELAELLDRGEALWINDSYWMFMPYKLKDSGVTLRYVGEESMEDGRASYVLEMTFAEVGRTPQNKYHVYVAQDSGLVEQWDYYRNADDPEPSIRGPWHNWQRYGEILLCDDHGERVHEGIAVLDEMPAAVYTSPEPVDWETLTSR